MSPFPSPWSKDTPWGLSDEATAVLWACADYIARRYPVRRDWMVTKHPRAWVELHGWFMEIAPEDEYRAAGPRAGDAERYLGTRHLLKLTPLGIAANTWGRSAKADERKAARREFMRLLRERVPQLSVDEALGLDFELTKEARRLEEGLRDTMREFAPMLAAARASL